MERKHESHSDVLDRGVSGPGLKIYGPGPEHPNALGLGRWYPIFPKQHWPNTTFVQNKICPKQHLPETTFFQNNICPKQHLPKTTFAQNTKTTLAQTNIR